MPLQPLHPLLASIINLAECYTKKTHLNYSLFSFGGSGVTACAFGPPESAVSDFSTLRQHFELHILLCQTMNNVDYFKIDTQRV
jgi:hypothetical protein